MRILFKLTSRSRPQRFFETMDNIVSHVSDNNYRIHCTLDTGDLSMNNPSVISRIESYHNTMYAFGKSLNKIDAINRDMDMVGDWDILVCMSDDMLFIKKGFDNDIRNSFVDNNGNVNLDQIVHFPDQHQGENCMTLHITGRDYYLRDGFIYDRRCKSLWADIIAQETAQARGKYKYVNNRIFNHNHPSFNDVPYDSQYLISESFEFRHHDYNVYLEAKKVYDPNGIFKTRGI